MLFHSDSANPFMKRQTLFHSRFRKLFTKQTYLVSAKGRVETVNIRPIGGKPEHKYNQGERKASSPERRLRSILKREHEQEVFRHGRNVHALRGREKERGEGVKEKQRELMAGLPAHLAAQRR